MLSLANVGQLSWVRSSETMVDFPVAGRPQTMTSVGLEALRGVGVVGVLDMGPFSGSATYAND